MKYAACVIVVGGVKYEKQFPMTNREVVEKFRKYIPKEFEDQIDYTCHISIPLTYNSPEYKELLDLLASYNIRSRIFLRSYYTKSELAKAEYFQLWPSMPLELEGTRSSDYGTKHKNQCDRSIRCYMCDELIGDVYVDRKFMKKKKFGTLFPDLFVSEELKEAIEQAELTGVEFGGLVKDFKGREMKEKYYVMHITSILPPLSEATWIHHSWIEKCGHVGRYLESDLMYEREKLAQAQDFNLTCEHLNNYFLQEVVVSARTKKALSKFRLMFRAPITIL